MDRIEHLAVENYRGASTLLKLDINPNKPVVLIFGENGTGKTTIADALDAIGNCAKGSLKDRSSTRARDHLPTIGMTGGDVRIELIMGGKTWRSTLSGDEIVTSPTARPKIRILRRKDLQKLIEAQPAQRYEALRHFIDVDKVERSESTLKGAADAAEVGFKNALKQWGDADAQLQEIWEREGKPGKDAVNWAKQIAAQDATKVGAEIVQLRSGHRAIEIAEAALKEFREAAGVATESNKAAQEVEREVTALPGIDAKQAISLTGLLRQAESLLKIGTHPDECPLCQQEISIEKLSADIGSRLTGLKTYDDLSAKRSKAAQKVSFAKQSVGLKVGSLFGAASTLLESFKSGENKIIAAAGFKAADYPLITSGPIASKDQESAVEQATKLISLVSAVKDKISAHVTKLTKDSGLINSIGVQYGQLQESEKTTAELDKLHTALQQAYNLARLARIEFTQKILDDIATETNRLYAEIHPKELIAISKLALDQGKRASLSQEATFEGYNNVPPQAYFSESHLDTLGFCFWLALAKRENPDSDAVIVLDDVFTSVDAQHLNRIAQLLTDESGNFAHVVITTHQRLWRDIYRFMQGAGKLTDTIELQRWSLAKGISNFKTKLAVDELIASIVAAPFDRQITASKLGVLLEATLDNLALQYRCRVARTADGEYTLGELLDGTTKLFNKLEVHRPELDADGNPAAPPNYLAAKVDNVLTKLRGLAFLRNQVGAHFNAAGSTVADADVELFAKLTVELAEGLSCPTCGQIPGKRTATYFACSCAEPHETRLLPLTL